MLSVALLHPDRLFSPNERERDIARSLYAGVKDLPIVSPHGHTNPRWFSENEAFSDPAALLIQPDHYLLRMLYSQGVPLSELGLTRRGDNSSTTDGREVWRHFAYHYHLFQGTPSRLWFDHALSVVFGIDERLCTENAARLYTILAEKLSGDAFRPRALFERFNIEVLATTESPLDDLKHHDTILAADWSGRIITTYRPDPVIDPEWENFTANVEAFGALAREDISDWDGYLKAHRKRRLDFKRRGATATDHGHPTALTANLPKADCETLYAKALSGSMAAQEAALFRGQMLTEMARMSLDDGLVMQIHSGVHRNHNAQLFAEFGRDMGADIPRQVDYVSALKPLLAELGNEPDLSIILFTLDESTYARELAPLAGHYPCLILGPPWWFYDSPEGMMRYKRQVLETAGFYNTAGFNDDTRAFLSIPARHDVARRIDCRHLAELVSDHRLDDNEAHELASLLANGLAKRAYRLDM